MSNRMQEYGVDDDAVGAGLLAFGALLLLTWVLQRSQSGTPASEWTWALTLGILVVVLAADAVLGRGTRDVRVAGTVYGAVASDAVTGGAYGATFLVGCWSLATGYPTLAWAVLLVVGGGGLLANVASIYYAGRARAV